MELKKTNAVLYPYSREATCISRNFTLTDYNVITAIVPGQLAEHCLNMSYFDDFNDYKIGISIDFMSSLQDCDAVIWAPYNYNGIDEYFSKVKEDISLAMTKGKNIVCLQTLPQEDLEHFTALANLHHVDFKYINYNDGTYQLKELAELRKIDTPVITVMGISEYVNKFETQLYVREAFLHSGYKVSQMGSKPYSELFGIRPFPSFMFDGTISEKQKILNLNHYISELETDENPEVIIIGVPGEIMKLEDRFLFHFGITPFLTSCAYNSDFTIFCMGCENVNSDFLTRCKEILRYRYTTSLDCIFMSNTRINEDVLKNDFEDLDLDVLTKPFFHTKKRMMKQCSTIPVFDIWDKKEDFVECVCETLMQEVL